MRENATAHKAAKTQRGKGASLRDFLDALAAMTPQSRQYMDDRGRCLRVRRGIGKPEVFFTGVGQAGAPSKRYKSPAVPARQTETQAQADLDRLAAKKGWILLESLPERNATHACSDRPGDLALEACRLLAEWAEGQSAWRLPDGLPVVIGAAEDALRAMVESEGRP